MSPTDPHREQLTRNMMALDEGMNRIAKKYADTVELSYEDPETFGAGHFVFYPASDARSRFVVDEQYTGTDWSDDERVPTSWTWAAERRVRDRDGAHVWGVEREGEVRSTDFRRVLAEAERWTRRVRNRAQASSFYAPSHRRHNDPPARGL